MSSSFCFIASSVFGATAIGLGAFGAHGLKGKYQSHPEGVKKMDNWSTAAHYQVKCLP